MIVPPLDSIDRFLELNAKVRARATSTDEHHEWQALLRALREGEVGARARKNPGEGRRHLRTTVRLLAQVQAPGGPAATVSASLGTGGLKLHAALPHEVGDHLQIAIPLPELAQPIRARARVAWRREGSLGIELIDVADSDREILESAVVEAMLRAR